MTKVLVVGAHPDEADMYAGGTAAALAREGHAVKFLSLTNGDAGHFALERIPLARRRAREAVRAAEHLGVLEYQIWDTHDGELEASIDMRKRVIEVIRDWRADVVIAFHDDCAGHPDNRAAGRVVRDAVAFCSVPNVVPDKPALDRAPLCLLMTDYGTGDCHRHDVAVDVDGVMEEKLLACAAHATQFFEFAPFERGFLDQVPPEDSWPERREFVLTHWAEFMLAGDPMRPALARFYGDEHAEKVRHAETFKLAGYGRQATDAEIRRLLPLF
ncbi:PIG-L deacetylase family protein [Planotetraspora sp. GP83]|uniref:PIG-L deacetylase family protein n=1 Tax=Planotetraspora sp. GP83 TaxID=3156264 RepID=UPI003518628F